MAHTDSARFGEKYRQLSDADLLSLAAAGEADFDPTAWRALSAELEKRQATVVEAVPSGPAVEEVDTGRPRFTGFLAVVRVLTYVALPVRALEALAGSSGVLSLLAIGLVVYGAYGMVLFERRDPATPKVWQTYHSLSIVYSVFVVLLTSSADSALLGALLSAVWLSYWMSARQVRDAFKAPA